MLSLFDIIDSPVDAVRLSFVVVVRLLMFDVDDDGMPARKIKWNR